MKSPSTIIAILEKAILVQENMKTAERRYNDYYNNRMGGAEWNRDRAAVNKAIYKRLSSYYARLIDRATPKVKDISDIYDVSSMD